MVPPAHLGFTAALHNQGRFWDSLEVPNLAGLCAQEPKADTEQRLQLQRDRRSDRPAAAELGALRAHAALLPAAPCPALACPSPVPPESVPGSTAGSGTPPPRTV